MSTDVDRDGGQLSRRGASRGMRDRILAWAVVLAFSLLPAGASQAVKATCPRYSVSVQGSSQFMPGYTYTMVMDLHKIGSAAGHDGKWQVTQIRQVNTFAHNTYIPAGPVAVSQSVTFAPGVSMDCAAHTTPHEANNVCTGGNFTLDVSGGKVGVLGKIVGKSMTIRFDASNPNDPELTGEIQEFAGGEMILDIISPGAAQKFVYSSDDPGVLELSLEARVTPSQYASDVDWVIPEIEGSKKTASSTRGQQVAVRYAGLPAKNGAFGKKTVTARLVVTSCKAEESRDFLIFHPRDASNHPGSAGTPNWFHYWSQTSARVGPAKFGGTSGKCASGGDYGKLMGYYRYQIFDSSYYICDLKSFGPDFAFQSVNWDDALPDNRQVTGIDTFAVASRHENAHYEHFTQWWKAHQTADKFEDTNQNGIKDSSEELLDKDKDEVPDSLEPQYGMNPAKRETLVAGVPDEELICWKAEASWKEGAANAEDWAAPGKQWKGP